MDWLPIITIIALVAVAAWLIAIDIAEERRREAEANRRKSAAFEAALARLREDRRYERRTR